MSTQPIPIILGPRPGTADSAASDLQQTVARVMGVLRRRRWLFALPMLTGIVLCLAGSLLLPRQYQVNALFERRDDAVITELISKNSPYSFETLRRSLEVDLAGYNAFSEAVDQLGLTDHLPRDASGELTPEGRAAKQRLILRLSKLVSVRLMEKSTLLDMIEVRYKGTDPELGMKLVTQLKDNYVARTRARIAEILNKSYAFFGQEAAARQARATRLEAELLQIIMEHPGVNPEDPDVLNEMLMRNRLAAEDLDRQRAQLMTDITAREKYLAEITGARAEDPAATQPAARAVQQVPNPERMRLSGEINRVRSEIADAKALKRMTDEHPQVKGLKQKLSELETALAAMPATIEVATGPVDQQGRPAVQTDRKRVEMELTSLRENLARTDRDLARLEAEKARVMEEKSKLFERRQNFLAQQQELGNIKRDLEVWKGHRDTIGRVLAAEAEARGIRFSTVEDARVPGKPVTPTVLVVYLVSLGVGLGLAVALVFIREILDRSLRDPSRVRQVLGVPVLEAIGELPRARRRRWERVLRPAPALVGVQAVLVVVLAAMVYTSLEQPAVYAGWMTRAAALCGMTGH